MAELERTAVRLHAAAIHLLRRLRTEDAATGMSPARLSALSVLVFGGPRTMGELAEAEQVTPPTMTRLVAGLVEAGLVERRPDPGDGRVVRVHATSGARQVLEAGRDRRVAHLAGLLERLAVEDVAVVDRATELLERVLGA
jgi:DNA-binding MarR family transcriptional regulator